jgi:hypothetical protein
VKLQACFPAAQDLIHLLIGEQRTKVLVKEAAASTAPTQPPLCLQARREKYTNRVAGQKSPPPKLTYHPSLPSPPRPKTTRPPSRLRASSTKQKYFSLPQAQKIYSISLTRSRKLAEYEYQSKNVELVKQTKEARPPESCSRGRREVCISYRRIASHLF